MPAERTFVDTNVLVYALDLTAGDKHHQGRDLMGRLWADGSGCLSIQVLQEFHVTITRKVPEPVPEQVSRRLIEALCHWRVHQPSCEDLVTAMDLQQQHQLSFWDAMIVTSAINLGCNRLLSEDLGSGRVLSGVTIVNPFASDA